MIFISFSVPNELQFFTVLKLRVNFWLRKRSFFDGLFTKNLWDMWNEISLIKSLKKSNFNICKKKYFTEVLQCHIILKVWIYPTNPLPNNPSRCNLFSWWTEKLKFCSAKINWGRKSAKFKISLSTFFKNWYRSSKYNK